MSEIEKGCIPGKKQRYKQYAIDGGLILGVGLLLTVIHFALPESVKVTLAFDHAQFNVWGLFTSAFVQYSDLQLAGNVVGYFLGVSYAYWLILEANIRDWFRRTFIALVVALPPLVVLTSYATFYYGLGAVLPPERGFSGVASGFGGFLLLALVIYLRRQYNPALGSSVGVTVLLLLLVEIDGIYSAGFDPRVVGLAAIGTLLVAGSYILEHGEKHSLKPLSGQRLKPVVLSALVILVLTVFVVGMFPADFVEDGSFTNIVGHAAGFIWGSLIAMVSYGISSWNEVI